jgi:hypothetical protein
VHDLIALALQYLEPLWYEARTENPVLQKLLTLAPTISHLDPCDPISASSSIIFTIVPLLFM